MIWKYSLTMQLYVLTGAKQYLCLLFPLFSLVTSFINFMASIIHTISPFETVSMDIKEIMEIIPHRQPFLLLDRIEEITEGESVTAIKNITYNEPFFAGHFSIIHTISPFETVSPTFP